MGEDRFRCVQPHTSPSAHLKGSFSLPGYLVVQRVCAMALETVFLSCSMWAEACKLLLVPAQKDPHSNF